MYNNSASKVPAFGGPSYQAERLLSVEVAGSSPAAVSSVLAFCRSKQEPWAVSTATEYRYISRGGVPAPRRDAAAIGRSTAKVLVHNIKLPHLEVTAEKSHSLEL